MENTYTKKTVIAIGATTVLHASILLLLLARLLLDHTDSEKAFPLPEIPDTWAKRDAPIRFVDFNESEKETNNQQEASSEAQMQNSVEKMIVEPTSIAPEIEDNQETTTQESQELPQEETHQQSQNEALTHGFAMNVENKPEPIAKTEEKKPITKEVRVKKRPAEKKPVPQRKLPKLEDLTDMFKMRMNQQAPVGDFFMQGNPHNLPPDQQIIFERYRSKLSAIIEQVKKENPMPCAVPLGVMIKIYLSLAQTGRFKELKITHSTGYNSIDNYCMTIYKIASERFPPIPSCLKESMFKGTITLQSTQSPQAGGWFCFN